MRDPDHEGKPPLGYLDAFLAVIGGVNGGVLLGGFLLGGIGGGIFASILVGLFIAKGRRERKAGSQDARSE
jgi:hypothetical protein